MEDMYSNLSVYFRYIFILQILMNVKVRQIRVINYVTIPLAVSYAGVLKDTHWELIIRYVEVLS